MRTALIVNPISGIITLNKETLNKIERLLIQAGFEIETHSISEKKSAHQITRDALRRGIEQIIVGGGDGTVSEVATEVIGKPVKLGILPLGTFNNVARSIGIPENLSTACEIISQRVVHQLDIGLANDSQYFFEAAGVGLDAVLFPLGEEIKDGGWNKIWPALRQTLEYREHIFQLTFDRMLKEAVPEQEIHKYRKQNLSSHTIQRRALFIVVANGPYYGGGFTIAPGARLSDGSFTISIYRNFSKFELIHHILRSTRGRFNYSPKVETLTAASVKIEAFPPFAAHVDGQPFGKTPLHLRTVPKALSVFGPSRLSSAAFQNRQKSTQP